MKGLQTFVVILLASLVNNVVGFDMTILHTNDVHARIEQINMHGGQCSAADASQGNCYGGFPRLKTKIKEIRASQSNTLLLDAGDQFSGTLWFSKFGGDGMATFMNYLGYDAMALGNHEFIKGDAQLIPFLDGVNFTIVSANTRLQPGSPIAGKFKKSHVFTFGEERLGVIGYTTPETLHNSNPAEHVSFDDEISAVRAEVTSLQMQGVNKIIAIGHSGFLMDMKVAAAVDGLDVIVGGHNNRFFYTGDKPPSNEEPQGVYPEIVTQANGRKVLIIINYPYAKYVGELRLTFDTNGIVTAWNGNPILLDDSVSRGEYVSFYRTICHVKFPGSYKELLINETEAVIGRTHVFLEGYSSVCRSRECNMGNVIADGMVRKNIRYRDSDDYWNDVSIAVVNAGSIRASIAKGDITQGKAGTVLPFSNTIDLVELNGRALLGVLEHSVSRHKEGEATIFVGFLQVSGLKIVYDISQPVGRRVKHARALCTRCEVPKYEDIRADDMYKVIMNSFLARGGDHYDVIKNQKTKHTVAGDLDLDIFVDYLRHFSPIIQGEEERISFVKAMDPCGPHTFPNSALPSSQISLGLFLASLLLWI